MKANIFTAEVYHDGCDSPGLLEQAVGILKEKSCYIGEDGHIRGSRGVLKSRMMREGHYVTPVLIDGVRHHFPEHRLVWQWVSGPVLKEHEVTHRDHNRGDNRISNLVLAPVEKEKEDKACTSPFRDRQAAAVKAVCSLCGKNGGDNGAQRKPSRWRRGVGISPEAVFAAFPRLVEFTQNASLGAEEQLKNYLLGLNGEVGELTDIFKKVFYHGKEYDPVDVMLEMGDVLWYCAKLANDIGYTLGEIGALNYEKLTDRRQRGVIHGSGDKR